MPFMIVDCRLSIVDSYLEFAVYLFVSNLVDPLALGVARVEPIGKVEDERIGIAHVLIRMNDARRHDHEDRILLAHDVLVAKGFAPRPVLPERHHKTTRDEAESVRLLAMLVRPARNSRMCHGEV